MLDIKILSILYLKHQTKLSIKQISFLTGYSEDERKIRNRLEYLESKKLVDCRKDYRAMYCPVSSIEMRKHILNGFKRLNDEIFMEE